MAKSSFNYDAYENGLIREGAFCGFSNQNFYQFMPANFNEDELNGWKVHISVSGDDVPEAWDSLIGFFGEHGLTAKVANPETAEKFADPDSSQRGKMITLYFKGDEDYAVLLEEIDGRLKENDIQPGHQVSGDREVQGSPYLHYRCDRDRDGNYISAEKGLNAPRPYNPEGVPDPFEDIRVGTPSSRLNLFAKNAKLEEHWIKDMGQGQTGKPNLRIFLDETKAKRVYTALSEQGVPAQLAQKGEDHLVMVPLDAESISLGPEAYKRAGEHYEAIKTSETLNSPEHAFNGGLEWHADPGKGATGTPHVRAVANSPKAANKLVERMRSVGLTADVAEKGDAVLVRLYTGETPAPDAENEQRRTPVGGLSRA